MLGPDAVYGWLGFIGALIGGAFVVWFTLVVLFAPHIPYKVHQRLACTSELFLQALHSTTLAPMYHSSRFEVLTDAVQFYPVMLEAIRGATRTVNMECYIFGQDETGRKFMAA